MGSPKASGLDEERAAATQGAREEKPRADACERDSAHGLGVVTDRDGNLGIAGHPAKRPADMHSPSAISWAAWPAIRRAEPWRRGARLAGLNLIASTVAARVRRPVM